MGTGVVAADRLAPGDVDLRTGLLAYHERAICHVAEVAGQTVENCSRVENPEAPGCREDVAGVADLTTALGIEGRPVEEDLQEVAPVRGGLTVDVLEGGRSCAHKDREHRPTS